MKTLLLSVFMISISALGFGQVEISGQVKTADTKQGLGFATIIVLNQADSALTMSLTDEKGFFDLNLDRGIYKLVFRYLGYKDDTLSIKAFSDQSLGIIYLEPASQQIEQVTVKADLKREDIDKDVILVTKEMRARSANIKDLLQQTPGVYYDRYNDNISVDGETNVLILVNGLKKDQNYINALNPDRIWKIEIIRDPGGRYGLEGYSAIINIILKDDFRGYEFYTEGATIIAPESNYAKLMSNQANMNLNLTYNKINMYTNVNFANPSFPLDMTVSRRFTDGEVLTKLPVTGYPAMIYKAQFLNMTAGVDYKINPLHTVSVESHLQNMINNNHTYSQTLFRTIDSLSDGTVSELYELTKQETPQSDINTSLFYKGKANHGLDMQGDMTIGKTTQKNTGMVRVYQDEQDINFDDLVLQPGDNTTVNTTNYLSSNFEATYTKGKLSLTSGLGYNYRKLSSLTEFFETSIEPVSQQYDESRFRGYLYGAWKPSDKFNIKLGSAFEQYNIKNNDLGKSMNFVQPYADIKWQPSQLVAFTVKYRSQATYPSASQLNPAIRQIAPRIAQTGNPDLTPAVQNRLSLRTDILGGLISIEPYYNFTDNYIAQIYTSSDNPDLDAVITYENIGKYTDYGTKFNLTVPFSKKIILQSSANIYWQQVEYQNTNMSIHDWRGDAQLIYYNPKIVTAGLLYQNQNSKRLTAQGYRTQNNDFVGMFVQKEMFDKKLSLMMFYVFPFNSTPGWIDYDNVTYTSTPMYNETSSINLDVLKNLLVFRVTYRFSKGKTVKVEKQLKQEQKLKVKSLF